MSTINYIMCTTESAANKKNTTKVADYTLPKLLCIYIEMKQKWNRARISSCRVGRPKKMKKKSLSENTASKALHTYLNYLGMSTPKNHFQKTQLAKPCPHLKYLGMSTQKNHYQKIQLAKPCKQIWVILYTLQSD